MAADLEPAVPLFCACPSAINDFVQTSSLATRIAGIVLCVWMFCGFVNVHLYRKSLSKAKKRKHKRMHEAAGPEGGDEFDRFDSIGRQSSLSFASGGSRPLRDRDHSRSPPTSRPRRPSCTMFIALFKPSADARLGLVLGEDHYGAIAVESVTAGSVAAASKLRVGDVIVGINGAPLRGGYDGATRTLASMSGSVQLQVERDN